MVEYGRRTILQLTGIASVGILAGCTDDPADGPEDDGDDDPNEDDGPGY